MKLWCEENWREYLPDFTHGWRDSEYAVSLSVGNRNCDPLVLIDLTFMPLWRDIGEAVQSALSDQRFEDYRAFGITWQMLLGDWVKRVERKLNMSLADALGWGAPDRVIVDDPPLDLRDVAE